MSEKPKPLLPEEPTPHNFRTWGKIVDHLIPELRKRGRNEEADELEPRKKMYLLVAETMEAKGVERFTKEMGKHG